MSLAIVMIKILIKECDKFGIQKLTHMPAKKLLTSSKGEVTGVLAGNKDQEVIIKAKSVIIATGGYGGNKELLSKNYPYYSDDMVYIGVPQNMGDGLLMAIEIGAAVDFAINSGRIAAGNATGFASKLK